MNIPSWEGAASVPTSLLGTPLEVRETPEHKAQLRSTLLDIESKHRPRCKQTVSGHPCMFCGSKATNLLFGPECLLHLDAPQIMTNVYATCGSRSCKTKAIVAHEAVIEMTTAHLQS